jgi:hypothetical protein
MAAQPRRKPSSGAGVRLPQIFEPESIIIENDRHLQVMRLETWGKDGEVGHVHVSLVER